MFGSEMLLCTICCRDSIIQVTVGESDYNNLEQGSEQLTAAVAGQEEALYTNPEKVVAALNLEVQGTRRKVSTHMYMYTCTNVYTTSLF